jgi:RimJ/RimL family protein N-acetyltransferase
MPELRVPDPPLADEVIVLRPWAEADIEPAYRATRDPVISRFTAVPENQSEADLRRFVAEREHRRVAGETLTLAIADMRSDAFLGTISLLRFVWRERRAEVGYWLAPWTRGRGVATRAVVLLSRWALQDLGLARLGLCTDTDNEASQAVATRAGFTREGVLRSYDERRGRRHDNVVFSLLPGDLS